MLQRRAAFKQGIFYRRFSSRERRVPGRAFFLLHLRLLSSVEPLSQDSLPVELGPDEVGDGRNFDNSPSSAPPDQHFKQLGVVALLDVDIEVADAGSNFHFDLVKKSHSLAQITCREYLSLVGVEMADQSMLFQADCSSCCFGDRGPALPFCSVEESQLFDDLTAFPENSGCFFLWGCLVFKSGVKGD